MDGVPDFSPHSSFSLSCRYRNYWDSFSSLRALTAAWAALPRSPPAPSDSLLRVEIGNTQNSLNILNRGSQFRKALDNRNTMHMPGIHLGLSRALFQIGEFTWLPSEQCWREMILQASAAKIRIWKCLQINLVRHVQCLWRKLPWGSNHGLEPRLSHSLKTWEGSQHFQQTAPVMLGKTTSKKKNQEVHLLQRFPSAFQRPGFIPRSCKLAGAELQQLQGRAVGHGWNAAAVALCGKDQGCGDMRALCHGDTASPPPCRDVIYCAWTAASETAAAPATSSSLSALSRAGPRVQQAGLPQRRC